MNAYTAHQANQEYWMAETFANKWALVWTNAYFIINRVLGITDTTVPLSAHALDLVGPILIDIDVDQEAVMSDLEE